MSSNIDGPQNLQALLQFLSLVQPWVGGGQGSGAPASPALPGAERRLFVPPEGRAQATLTHAVSLLPALKSIQKTLNEFAEKQMSLPTPPAPRGEGKSGDPQPVKHQPMPAQVPKPVPTAPLIEQVRAAVQSLSASLALLNSPKADPVKEAAARLKPLVEQLIAAVETKAEMHSAREGESARVLSLFKSPLSAPRNLAEIIKRAIESPTKIVAGKEDSVQPRAQDRMMPASLKEESIFARPEARSAPQSVTRSLPPPPEKPSESTIVTLPAGIERTPLQTETKPHFALPYAPPHRLRDAEQKKKSKRGDRPRKDEESDNLLDWFFRDPL